MILLLLLPPPMRIFSNRMDWGSQFRIFLWNFEVMTCFISISIFFFLFLIPCPPLSTYEKAFKFIFLKKILIKKKHCKEIILLLFFLFLSYFFLIFYFFITNLRYKLVFVVCGVWTWDLLFNDKKLYWLS